MAESVRRRSWGGVLPLGRHASIRGSRLIHCASVSIAPSLFQERQNARNQNWFKLEQTLASRLMFPSTRTEQAGGTDLERHHDKSRSVCSSTSDRFADSELCSDDYATNHHDHSRVRRWRGRTRSERRLKRRKPRRPSARP